MSRNGAGVYSLPAGNPVTTGTAISSTVQNNTTADIATALTQSIAYDGQTTPIANLPMGGYKHTNVANASNATDYAAYGQVLPLTGGTVTGATTFSSTLAVTGAATLSSTLAVTGNETVGGTLDVTGLSTLASLAVTGNETVGGTLEVTGVATFAAGPIAPTAAVNTNTTQLATTAFVRAQIKAVPYFRAINVGAQSLSSGVSTKVTLGTIVADTASCFASSRFTPNVPGYYQLNGEVSLAGTNITIALLSLFVNGTEYSRGSQINDASGTANKFGAGIADSVFMNGTTDYVELYASVTATTPSIEALLARFSGFLARPA